MDTIPRKQPAINEWPNPPWNTVYWEWDAAYEHCTPQWFAQRLALDALKYNLVYSTENTHTQAIERSQVERNRNVSTSVRKKREEGTTHHGVLSSCGLLTICSGNWQEKEASIPSTLSGLCELALKEGLTHLWVMSSLTADASYFKAALPEWDLLATWTIEEEIAKKTGVESLLVSCVGCKRPKGGQAWFSIIFTQNTQWSWIDDDLTQKLLLQTIKKLEDELNIPIGGGPSTVGMKLLEKHSQKEWLARAASDAHADAFRKSQVQLIASRPLLDSEQQGYLHKLDKSSAYLRSCVSSPFGTGTPVYHEGDCFEEKRIGVYHASVTQPQESLPFPITKKSEGWFMGNIVSLLRSTGHTVTIDEGWGFPIPDGQKHNHYVLKAWSGLIWEKRLSFKLLAKDETLPAFKRTVYENCQWAMKDIATTTVGLFASKVIEKDTRSWKFHPDIEAVAVSVTTANMHYNIQKVKQECGLTPIMAYMDALFYVTDSPNPSAIKGLHIDPLTLGAYKHEWAIPLTNEVRDVLTSQLGTNVKISKLNAIAEGNNYNG